MHLIPLRTRYSPLCLNQPAINMEAAAPSGYGGPKFSHRHFRSGFPFGCNQVRPETPAAVVQWVTIACRDNFLQLYLSIYCGFI